MGCGGMVAPGARHGFVGLLALVGALVMASWAESAHGQGSDDVRSSPDTAGAREVERALGRMTLDDKISLVTGAAKASTDPIRSIGFTPPIRHDGVDVPALYLGDGPNGVGNGNTGVTQFPTAIAVAASWDVDLAKAYGEALGAEWAGKAENVGLGPGLNIDRLPYNGRTAEYAGEDPYLAGQIAASEIQGIQGQHVIATAKHYALNNQEVNRSGVDVVVSERAAREIYLPAFEASVRQGGAGAIMCAYNRIGGAYACENPRFLTDILRGEWGFTGFVMSDWGANHSTAASALAGLDLEMPGTGLSGLGASYYGSALEAAVRAGTVPEATLDAMVRRILTSMHRVGLFDHRNTTPAANVSTPAHRALALRIAQEGAVLLKNAHHLLPLSRTAKVAVLGPAAEAFPPSGIGGSGAVNPSAPVITPLAGIRAAIGEANVVYAQGAVGTGAPAALPASQIKAGATVGDTELLQKAIAAAREADVAVVCVGDAESEGADHGTSLPGGQDELVASVAAVARRTVVVLATGSALVLPWADRVDAVLESWYGGQEMGTAVAALLFGDANPSGKTVVTFAASEAQLYARQASQYPGTQAFGAAFPSVSYDEGILVGYRWFDQRREAPLFPFGHGLSYTTFAYDDLRISPSHGRGPPVTIQATIRNSGARAGAEVAQLYLGFPAWTGEPPRQLKGFQKVTLAPGKRARVTFQLDARAFSFWDDATHGWTVARGEHQILVGSSSRDIRLAATFTVR